MSKNLLLTGVIMGLIVFWATSLHARFGSFNTNDMNKPVVIELFTSQSCSSCPPADENLAKLAENPNVIALGFHVTYWDHLHWKDTLSHQFATDRQRAYSRYVGKSRVYTPQMIVNGTREFVGSRGGDIANALKAANTIEPITVSVSNDNILTIDLPTIENDTYTLWIAGIKHETTQSIGSGENSGKTVTYKNAVIEYASGGDWNGNGDTRQLEGFDNKEIDAYIVIAQKSGYGPINAAGQSN